MARRPTVSLVGCGRAGGAIGLALRQAGYPIAAVWSRSPAGRRRAARLLDAPVTREPAEAAAAGKVTIVAVPDDAIGETGARLAPGVTAGAYVVHTSGATPVSILSPARERGARIGSLHPLQTLPDARRGAEALRGAGVAVTCAPDDLPFLRRLAAGWGGKPFPLPDGAKGLYHAAAVFASNYVVASLGAAVALLEAAGVEDPGPLLAPLARAAVENVAAKGPRGAVTGPVARGDLGVVRRHLEELTARSLDGAVAEAYRSMAVLTASVAGRDPSQVSEAMR